MPWGIGSGFIASTVLAPRDRPDIEVPAGAAAGFVDAGKTTTLLGHQCSAPWQPAVRVLRSERSRFVIRGPSSREARVQPARDGRIEVASGGGNCRSSSGLLPGFFLAGRARAVPAWQP